MLIRSEEQGLNSSTHICMKSPLQTTPYPFIQHMAFRLALLLISVQVQAQQIPSLLNASFTDAKPQLANLRAGQARLSPIVVGNGITPTSYTSAVGVPFTLDISYAFSDPGGKPFTYFLGGVVNSLTINPTTGVISGSPQVAGRFGVTVAAQDDANHIVYSGFTLITKGALEITSPQSATVGVPVSIPTAYAFFLPAALSCNSLPPGLSFDPSTGMISGTPTLDGRFGITIAGQNNLSQLESHGFFLDVKLNPAINEAPRRRASGVTSPLAATIGQGLSLSVVSAYDFYDPEGLPLTYVSSPMPAGLNFDATTGVISGTPTAIGQFGITIGASDGNSTIYAGFYLQITNSNATNLPPVVVSNLPPPLTRDINLGLSIPTAYAFSDPENRPLTFLSSPLPQGLSINTITGVISGTPVVPGEFGITIGVTDDGGSTIYSGFYLTINLPPVVVGNGLTSPISCTSGVPITIPTAYAFADPEGKPLTFSASPAVARGLTLDPVTGVISGTPIGPIRAGITIIATDEAGSKAYSGFYLFSEGQSLRVASSASREAGNALQVKVLENPTQQEQVTIQIEGVDGQSVWVRSLDSQGYLISSSAIEVLEENNQASIPIGRTVGVYYVQVSTTSQRKVIKVLRQ